MRLHLTTSILRPDLSEVTAHIEVDYSPPSRGNSNGHPDSWTPPEPAEVEIVSVEGVSMEEAEAWFSERQQTLEDLAEMAWQMHRARLREVAS